MCSVGQCVTCLSYFTMPTNFAYQVDGVLTMSTKIPRMTPSTVNSAEQLHGSTTRCARVAQGYAVHPARNNYKNVWPRLSNLQMVPVRHAGKFQYFGFPHGFPILYILYFFLRLRSPARMLNPTDRKQKRALLLDPFLLI